MSMAKILQSAPSLRSSTAGTSTRWGCLRTGPLRLDVQHVHRAATPSTGLSLGSTKRLPGPGHRQGRPDEARVFEVALQRCLQLLLRDGLATRRNLMLADVAARAPSVSFPRSAVTKPMNTSEMALLASASAAAGAATATAAAFCGVHAERAGPPVRRRRSTMPRHAVQEELLPHVPEADGLRIVGLCGHRQRVCLSPRRLHLPRARATTTMLSRSYSGGRLQPRRRRVRKELLERRARLLPGHFLRDLRDVHGAVQETGHAGGIPRQRALRQTGGRRS